MSSCCIKGQPRIILKLSNTILRKNTRKRFIQLGQSPKEDVSWLDVKLPALAYFNSSQSPTMAPAPVLTRLCFL